MLNKHSFLLLSAASCPLSQTHLEMGGVELWEEWKAWVGNVDVNRSGGHSSISFFQSLKLSKGDIIIRNRRETIWKAADRFRQFENNSNYSS